MKLFLLVLIFLFAMSCETKKKDVKSKKKADTTDGLKKYYSTDGKLKTELTILKGKRNGIARTYYKNGKVSLEMNYKTGKRDGLSKRYYEDGTLYQETNYKDDKIDGIRKKYREDGKPMAIARYENDHPCSGLREFLLKGGEKDNFPSIVISPEDRLKREGVYIINLSLSDKSRRVKFYIGNLSSSGCLTEKLISVMMDKSTGTGKIPYTLPPGAFMMEELNFVAELETMSGNTFITQKKFYVSIEN
jgi:MORN repeat variant